MKASESKRAWMNRPSGLFDAIRYRSFDFRSIHSSASYLPAPFKFPFNYFLFFFNERNTKMKKTLIIRRTMKRSCFWKKSEFIIDCTAKWNDCATLISRSRVHTRSFLAMDRQLDDPRGGSLGRTSFDASIALETMPVFKEWKWNNGLIPGYKSLYDYTRVSFHDEKNFPNVKSI